jgi:tRNA(Ile2)-agmatinylcytidine synthase
MVYVGLDDTDSPRGGCTTWVLSELLREPGPLDLIGFPRLVRLNPNVPFKTRGNAALAARLGHGTGTPRLVGRFRGAGLRAFPRGRPPTPREVQELSTRVRELLMRTARWEDPQVDPAFVLSPRPLPEALYWSAVRETVPVPQVERLLRDIPGACWEARGSGQGLVGAAASLAWPHRRATYELLAYRDPLRWGEARTGDPREGERISLRYPSTFHNYDPRTRRLMLFPHTPCPILYGIRGRDPRDLPRASRLVGGEVPERWVIFRTNQASGDHLKARTLSSWPPGTSGVVEASVVSEPERLPGGHVRLRVRERDAAADAYAFEPTKTLPRVARELLPGDRVRIWGSRPWGEGDLSLNLEGLRVLAARPVFLRTGRPRCPRCGGRSERMGRHSGFRCRPCGVRLPPEAAPGRWVSRSRLLGAVHPTPSARRHLAPLPGRGWP